MKSGDQEFALDSCLASIVALSHHLIPTEKLNAKLLVMGTEDADKNDQTLTLPKPSRYVVEFSIYVA